MKKLKTCSNCQEKVGEDDITVCKQCLIDIEADKDFLQNQNNILQTKLHRKKKKSIDIYKDLKVVEVGDLVATKGNSCWGTMVGIVTANEKTGWWLLKDCVDIHNCCVDIRDISKILVKQIIAKKYQKYLIHLK